MSYSYSTNNTGNNGYSWYQCECCPYGYHIDLDFVRYCESIGQEADRSGSIKRRKDRRRQRQSMEVLLGLTPFAALAEQNHQCSIAESPEVVVGLANNEDGFDDAVQDFEQTLRKSKKYNLPDVTAVSGVNMTVAAPQAEDHATRDSDAGVDCGLTPAALQNIREQMALSLERTKELEDQVKLIPVLKAQLAALGEEKRQLVMQLKVAEAARSNANYGRNRSQSVSEMDSLESATKTAPRPPTRRDFGVMCGVLTRDVGVGQQYPHTRNASTLTKHLEESAVYSDKWYNEKIKFLTSQNENLNYVKDAKFGKTMVTQNTQTPVSKKLIVECGVQTPPNRSVLTNNSHTQTADVKKQIYHALTQTAFERRNVGTSIESPCEKCNVLKTSVGVGSDHHQIPVSLANLAVPRSRSFNLGTDKLNLSTRSRTVACQYEAKTHSRACQNDSIKTCHRGSQHEYDCSHKVTDTKDLGPEKAHAACEAKESPKERADAACNTPTGETTLCTKCAAREREKEEVMRKEGSPTPSRIPRPQIPTTPVENRKFRRQDTYTKIPASPTDKPSSPIGLSGLEFPLRTISSEPTSPLEKVKTKLQDHAPSSSSRQNNATKVQVQEVTLPVPESTLQLIAQKHRKKAEPSVEMQAAIKVVNDSLQKGQNKNLKNQLKNATNIIQQEWFKISSLVTANPLDVEDYLDAFEDVSSPLLEYIVNMTDASGNTAMHYAVSHGNFDVVSILLDSKVCDINKTNKAGYTSTMLVSLAEVRSQTHANVVRRLFKLADVNVRAKQHGQTALMLAVSHGRLDMVQMLLEAGADINIQDEDGSTALMCAAEHGHVEIVKHFLSQPDCDSGITDVDGSTALKIAMEAGHRHIGVLLYAHERSLHGTKHKKSKSASASPKTPSSPLPFRSNHRALTDAKQGN